MSGDSNCELLGLEGTTPLLPLLVLLLSLGMAGNLMVVGTDKIGVGLSHNNEATQSGSDAIVFGLGTASFPVLNAVSDDRAVFRVALAVVADADFCALSTRLRDGDFWAVLGDNSADSF